MHNEHFIIHQFVDLVLIRGVVREMFMNHIHMGELGGVSLGNVVKDFQHEIVCGEVVMKKVDKILTSQIGDTLIKQLIQILKSMPHKDDQLYSDYHIFVCDAINTLLAYGCIVFTYPNGNKIVYQYLANISDNIRAQCEQVDGRGESLLMRYIAFLRVFQTSEQSEEGIRRFSEEIGKINKIG